MVNNTDIPTAAILVIGDEILSGRTKDKNVGFIADRLTELGIDLKEVRIISDEQPAIVSGLNALRAAYTYVFTTGGIGPTHDDITADSVAAAFGVTIDIDQRAVDVMLERYEKADLTESRLRMARIPAGAELIANPVSKAPGFQIGNVFVMAGVPNIMQAMMDDVSTRLKGGQKMLSLAIEAGMGEGMVAKPLAELQLEYPDVSLGSYPYMRDGKFQTSLVLRCRDEERLNLVAEKLADIVTELQKSNAD
ncbi:MAG: competence/damage-inducible protein A [Hyphomicrobiales bacterium]|nr:competence/damage-inducible protein A [Hyphomicrobiales bacterium]PCJ91825.1 MAG: competence/damage-inducible protein A [Hyphomicrobiales bacterium]